MTAPTPPPIFDADELRKLAEACPDNAQGYCNECRRGVTFCTCTARYEFRHATSRTVVLALLDERATLLARVEAVRVAVERAKAARSPSWSDERVALVNLIEELEKI